MEEDPTKTALIMHLSIVYPTLQMLGDLLSESSLRVGAQSGLSQSTLMVYTFSFVNCLWKTFVNSTNTHVSLSYTVHHREIWDICKGRVCRFVPHPRAPLGEKWSGERSRISWAYYPKQVMTNEIARSVIIT